MFGFDMPKLPAKVVVDNADNFLRVLGIYAAAKGAPGALQGVIRLLEKVVAYPAIKPFLIEALKKTGAFSAAGPEAGTMVAELEAVGVMQADMIDTQALFGCDQCDCEDDCSDPS